MIFNTPQAMRNVLHAIFAGPCKPAAVRPAGARCSVAFVATSGRGGAFDARLHIRFVIKKGDLVMNKIWTPVLGILACSAMGFSASALAQVEYDQDVTPAVIFGAGNSNGGFTTDRESGVEVGLRAKVPYVGILHSNGDGIYSYSLAETLYNASKPRAWNFEFSVNTDYDGSTGLVIDDLTYELGLDADPTLGTDFLTFDPISIGWYDHSIGTNSTANGGGTEATDQSSYDVLTANNNVLQQSWRYAWFPMSPLDAYNPDIPGTYAVYFLARDSEGTVVARTDIQVLIGGAPPVGPQYACDGFVAPLDEPVILKKKNRVLPLRMTLADAEGTLMTGSEIVAAPVMQLTYDGSYPVGAVDLTSVDTAGQGDDGNVFTFGDDYWALNMMTKGLAAGSYTITVVSGDVEEYVVDPTCEAHFTVQ
jgi:hypothetical protein